jgi:hypothetical protein
MTPWTAGRNLIIAMTKALIDEADPFGYLWNPVARNEETLRAKKRGLLEILL